MTRSKTGKRMRSLGKKISGSRPKGTLRRRASRVRSLRSSMRTSSRSRSSNILGMPRWVAFSLGVTAFGGLVFGLTQLDAFNDMMEPVIHDVGEFFGLTDEHGIDTTNITHDRIYSSATSL